ncbi:MAG: CDP-alcohol phosphatidyltransferase family protein [Gemmatimonadota bacterium]
MTNRGGPRHDPGFLTVANIISLTRIPLGVSFLAVSDRDWLVLIVVLGAVTDLLDGWIARITGTMSEIGILIDPFCDKLFVLLGVTSFIPGPYLDWAGFLILILRDIFTSGVYLVGRLTGNLVPLRSRLGGKVTTALQVLTLFALIVRPEAVPLLILLVGCASVYAIIDYGMAGTREAEERQPV